MVILTLTLSPFPDRICSKLVDIPWKGVTRNVYSKRYPYAFTESIFIHQSRQRKGPMVHLYHFGIHHPFYHFHLFKCFSVHQYAFRPKCEPTSILHIYGIQQIAMG